MSCHGALAPLAGNMPACSESAQDQADTFAGHQIIKQTNTAIQTLTLAAATATHAASYHKHTAWQEQKATHSTITRTHTLNIHHHQTTQLTQHNTHHTLTRTHPESCPSAVSSSMK